MSNTVKCIISIALPLAVGIISRLFTTTGVENWYQTLARPFWNPPNWIFAPVWTILYILMGLSLYLVWKADASLQTNKNAIVLFSIQLALNFFWSFIFFREHQVGLALAEIIVMWIFILATIFSFSQFSKTAAWLLVPYISWVSFAAILNYTIWKLNT